MFLKKLASAGFALMLLLGMFLSFATPTFARHHRHHRRHHRHHRQHLSNNNLKPNPAPAKPAPPIATKTTKR